MPYLLAVVAGALNMLQSGSNATLHQKPDSGPVVPALVAYATGMLAVLAACPSSGARRRG